MEGRDVLFGGTVGLPGKRSVGHTGPLLSGVSAAGLRVVTAGVTPRAESGQA